MWICPKEKLEWGKKNFGRLSWQYVSEKFPFTKATHCPQDVGAVEDTQVGISTAGHLPQTVTKLPQKNLCVVAKAEYFKILLPHTMKGYGVRVALILIST